MLDVIFKCNMKSLNYLDVTKRQMMKKIYLREIQSLAISQDTDQLLETRLFFLSLKELFLEIIPHYEKKKNYG